LKIKDIFRKVPATWTVSIIIVVFFIIIKQNQILSFIYFSGS